MFVTVTDRGHTSRFRSQSAAEYFGNLVAFRTYLVFRDHDTLKGCRVVVGRLRRCTLKPPC